MYEEKNLVVCNANDHVIVYRSLEGGKILEERYRFKADFSQKDATIVCWILIRILYVFRMMER